MSSYYSTQGIRNMLIAIASDHRGFQVKQRIITQLTGMGFEIQDFGPHNQDCVDYPDYAFEVANVVSMGTAERGILVCGTGIGMCIAANKVSGIRAAPCHDSITAEMSRRHNNANVLCLSADFLGEQLIEHMVKIWIETPFERGRHARRVEKIQNFENGYREIVPKKEQVKEY